MKLVQLRSAASCQNEVILPWSKDTVDDPKFKPTGPVYQELPKPFLLQDVLDAYWAKNGRKPASAEDASAAANDPSQQKEEAAKRKDAADAPDAP